MIVIDLANSNDFVTQVTLDSVIYRIHMAWSGDDWTMDIRDADNNDIIRGIMVRANFPLLLPYSRHLTSLRGQIMAIVNDGNAEITRDCFIKGRAKLVYVTANEVEAIKNE